MLAASSPADYADTLLTLAVDIQPRRILLGSMGIFGFRWKLEDRVRDLLHDGRDRNVRLGRRARAALFVLVALVLVAAGVFRVGVAAEAEAGKTPADNTTEETVLSDASEGTFLNVDGQPWQPGYDLDGEPLPQGVIAQLGSRRLRHRWADRIAILPDNQRLLSWGRHAADVRLWDLKSGKLLRTLDLDDLSLSAAALSRDGRSFVALVVQLDQEERKSICELRLFDTDTWRESVPAVWTDEFSDRNEVAISQNGSTIATGSSRGEVRLWDVNSESLLKQCAAGKRKVEALEFSPDSSLAIAMGDRALLWDWAEEDQPKPLDGSPDYAQALAFSPDGRLLATGHVREAAAELWDVPSRRHVATLKGPAKNHYREQMTFSPDGKTLIVPGNPAKVVEMFDVHTGQLTQSLDAGTTKPRDVAISPNGKYLAAVGSQTAIKLWEMPEARLKTDRFTGHVDSVQEIVYTPDGRQIVTGGVDGTIRIWQARTGRPLRVLQCDNWIVGLGVSPDGMKIASCSLDDTVRLWDAQSGREIFRLPGHGRMGGNMNYGVGFDRTGKRFLSFGIDLNLRVWSTETGKLVAEFPIRPSEIKLIETEDGPTKPNGLDLGGPVGVDESLSHVLRGVAFSAAGDRLLVHCENTLYLFDTASGKEVDKWTPKNSMDQCTMSHDGGTIITTEVQGQLAFGRPDFLVTLRLHRGSLGKDVVEMKTVPSVFIRTLALSPDGQLLATVTANRDTPQQYSIRVDRVETGEPVAHIETEPSQFPSRMVFAPDGQSLAVPDRDTATLVWDLQQFPAASGGSQ